MRRNLLVLLLTLCHITAASAGGTWHLLQKSIGITSMHMQLLNTDHILIYDRTDFGLSNISLPNGKCRFDQYELALKKDCTAHSVEYDVASNSVRPLMVLTDVWCSSGSLMPDGSVIQTGGFNDGDRVVRRYRPCQACDWIEIPHGLEKSRWYATNHLLPDGRQIIVGGRKQFNYEFYPKKTAASEAYYLPFLRETHVDKQENNLYPFVFLNPDGNLFIFANNRAILFDYLKGRIVKSFPEVPDGNPRNYPSTGSAVLLPLRILRSEAPQVEVLVCGGAPRGAYANARKNIFVRALDTCARIKITDPSPKWVMETMPMPRVMGDMVLQPNGNVLIINGAGAGTAGWEHGRDPVLKPVTYKPDKKLGSRFEIHSPSTIPRMYHSTAILLRDGRIMVGGSNPHIRYRFSGVLYPTELSLEAFSPEYLDARFAHMRPKMTGPDPQATLRYGQVVPIRFTTTSHVFLNLVTVTMVAPSFNTHSFSMNQRLLVLGSNATIVGKMKYEIRVNMPSSANLAPPGYYMLFVVHHGMPSEGLWILIH